MEYYVLVAVSVGILSVGFVLVKRPFFTFALATTSLLDTMLDAQRSAEEKQRELIGRLGWMLVWFAVLLLLLGLNLFVAWLPFNYFLHRSKLAINDLDFSSWRFFVAMIVGSLVMFIPSLWRTKKDYTDWSRILHKMILDNYHISRALFKLDKFFFRRKLTPEDREFVVVTGLARAGTTALTSLLHKSGQFHSLSYDSMPFLLSVNLWRLINRPRPGRLKDRAHGDRVRIGYHSVEALEEYFFKVFLNNSFIGDRYLSPHVVDETIQNEYLRYQKLIRRRDRNTHYLAKNNNFMLRYSSMREGHPDMRVILLFRRPEDQAASLLKQHANFRDHQNRDPFVLEYMDWLGHHEFGRNHRPLVFDLEAAVQVPNSESNLDSIDYWLHIWIHYYSYVLSLDDDENLFLVDYADLLNHPKELLDVIGEKTNFDLGSVHPDSFAPSKHNCSVADLQLVDQANRIYHLLRDRRIK